MNFIPALGIRANSCAKWHRIFKELSQVWGRADFSETSLSLSLKKDLLNKLASSKIHLGGEYHQGKQSCG
jgi:hypothetical protein